MSGYSHPTLRNVCYARYRKTRKPAFTLPGANPSGSVDGQPADVLRNDACQVRLRIAKPQSAWTRVHAQPVHVCSPVKKLLYQSAETEPCLFVHFATCGTRTKYSRERISGKAQPAAHMQQITFILCGSHAQNPVDMAPPKAVGQVYAFVLSLWPLQPTPNLPGAENPGLQT